MKFIIVIYDIYILIIISVIVIHGQDNNVNNNNPDDPMFQGQYKAVKGGVGAAFTEGADWDGLKDADKTVPPDFKTTGLPSIDKQTDDFEGKMQKQAQNDLDKSTLNLPTITKNFHDTSSNSLQDEKKWEDNQKNRLPVDTRFVDGKTLPPPAAAATTSSNENKKLRNNNIT